MTEHLRSQRSWNFDRLDRTFARQREGRLFDFVTAATASRTPQELIAALKKPVFSCGRLVDVRNNPNSQHIPHWNKNAISGLFSKAGIEYVHRPDMGVPAEQRRRLHSGAIGYPEFFRWYDSNVLTDGRVAEARAYVDGTGAAFLCTEVGPTYCHRHRIALALESRFGYIGFDL